MRDLNVTSLPAAFRNARASVGAGAAVFVACCTIVVGQQTWAQPPAAHKQPGGAGTPKVPAAPLTSGGSHNQMPMVGPGGAMMRPGPAGQTKAGTRPIPGAPTGKGPASELKIDSVTLPEDFTPPTDPDPLMEIRQRLATPDEMIRLKKDLERYKSTLRLAKISDADKALIRGGIRYRLSEMCQSRMPDAEKGKSDLNKLREDLLREINGSASAPENPKAIRDFRQMLMQELLNQAVPLLDSQNFHVRLQLVILIGKLDLTEDDPKNNLRQEAFAPANAPLVKVVLDPAQPVAIKVPATNALVRILRLGNANVGDRTKIAEAFISELKNKKNHSWYQMRLVGALGNIDVALDQQRKPFVVDMLKEVLADDERTWQVRSEAAYALGRVPLPQACNPPTVVRAIGEFALKLAKAAQQQPPQNDRDPKWRAEFIKVYLAFQQQDKDDMLVDKSGAKAGLLNNPAVQAKPLYNLIVPMAAAVLHGQRLTVQQVQTLEVYLTPQGNADGGALPTSPAGGSAEKNKVAAPNPGAASAPVRIGGQQ